MLALVRALCKGHVSYFVPKNPAGQATDLPRIRLAVVSGVGVVQAHRPRRAINHLLGLGRPSFEIARTIGPAGPSPSRVRRRTGRARRNPTSEWSGGVPNETLFVVNAFIPALSDGVRPAARPHPETPQVLGDVR